MNILKARAQEIIIPRCINALTFKVGKVVIIIVKTLVRIVRLIVPQVRNRFVKSSSSISTARCRSVYEGLKSYVAVTTCVVFS